MLPLWPDIESASAGRSAVKATAAICSADGNGAPASASTASALTAISLLTDTVVGDDGDAVGDDRG